MIKRINGFTLAEILITLSIIGVIASMTIPSLVQDVQDAQFKSAAKKAFSDITNATRLIMLDNANTLKGAFNNPAILRDKYLEHLNYIKKCDNTNFLGNCWNDFGAYSSDGSLFQSKDWWSAHTVAGAVLNNGECLYFEWWESAHSNCSNTSPCNRVFVDVNCKKGPNKIGRDIFLFQSYSNGKILGTWENQEYLKFLYN